MSRVKYFANPIGIVHYVAVCDDGNSKMLLEVIDSRKISLSRKSLLIGSTMDRYQIGSCIFQTFAKFYEKRVICPAETRFDGDRNFYRLGHFFYNTECSIPIDHEG